MIDFENLDISIHVPREGDDLWLYQAWGHRKIFQSTSPVRGTTAVEERLNQLTEGFQSTSPVRGTTPAAAGRRRRSGFQSTSPVRGTT